MYRDLIAVTNRHLCSRPFTEQITRVCKLHPKALILREKDLPEEEYFSLARQVKEICEQFKVPFIPHFYPAVARELGCDRLHLPLPLLLENPKVVSDFHTVGTSIHSVSEAVEAEKLGTSYLTAGHLCYRLQEKAPATGTSISAECMPSCADSSLWHWRNQN